MTGEHEKEHDFKLTPLVQVSTCEKCGLLRLKTLSGEYYFVKFSEPYLHCNSPYRNE